MASTISAHTHNYLLENRRAVEKFVDNFPMAAQNRPPGSTERAEYVTVVEGRQSEPQELPMRAVAVGTGNGSRSREVPLAASNNLHAEPASELSGTSSSHASSPCHYIPLPENGRFVGQDATLRNLREKLFGPKRSRRVAVVGLGGIGKTQVALQVAYWAKKNRSQYSVLWVPALSNATFEQAYTEIAKKLGVRRADDENIKDAVRRHLSSEEAGPWLLVVDNADDMNMVFGGADGPGIIDYLPASERGVMLLTTRSTEIAVNIAGPDMIELGNMDEPDAKRLIGELLFRQDLLSDDAATAELLDELVYLPLAIVQATAYLNLHYRSITSIAEYLRLLRGTEQDTIGLLSREFHDNSRYRGTGNAVATTWLVSFDQIRNSDTAAADLLMFMSHIEPKAIPRSILPRMEPEEEMVHAIGTLCTYAFLSRREESDIYDMHSLVHLATRVWMQKHGFIEEARAKAMRHVAKVFPTDDYENRSLWQEYIPHTLRLVQGSQECDLEERYSLYFWIGRCLRVDGRIREAVECLEVCCLWRDKTLGETDPVRLASQHNLAIAYQANGNVTKAIELLEHVVTIREKTLGETHSDRLASEGWLARMRGNVRLEDTGSGSNAEESGSGAS